MSTPTVAFSELSKNSKRVAETLDRAQRVHITRRDTRRLPDEDHGEVTAP
jgi:hypothetical protein